MFTLSPSILASNMLNLGDEIKKIEASGSKYVHIDIMDGSFVPNISFGMPVLSAVRSCTDLVIDVHAMIVNPDKYIDEFIDLGADIITFHIEALERDRIISSIEKIHQRGKKVGLSIKPNTDVSALYPYLELIDMVLIMTVEPGFGGQKFMHAMMDKVKAVKAKISDLSRDVDIQVDGGINIETLKIAKNSGANIFVLGTAFFKNEKILNAEQLLSE